jgi:hypothetical protein
MSELENLKENIIEKIEVIIYKTYHPSQRKANKKYYENNKEFIYQKQREKHLKKIEEDKEYYEAFKRKQREAYYRKKEQKLRPDDGLTDENKKTIDTLTDGKKSLNPVKSTPKI